MTRRAAAPRLQSQQQAGLVVAGCLNMQLLFFADRSEYPVSIVSNGEAARPRRIIAETQAVYLYRVARSFRRDRNKHRQLLPDRMAVVLEDCVSLPVTCTISILFANRRRRGSPDRAAFIVAEINHLGLRIAHRIVVPGSEAVGLAVTAPREGQPALTPPCSQRRVGH